MAANKTHSKAQKIQSRSLVKPGFICVILQGRHAGQKCVIVRPAADKKTAVVVGISRSPRTLSKSMNLRQLNSRAVIKTFVKSYNLNHLMITRHSVTPQIMEGLNKSVPGAEAIKTATGKKVALKSSKRLLRDRMVYGDSWLYSKLPF